MTKFQKELKKNLKKMPKEQLIQLCLSSVEVWAQHVQALDISEATNKSQLDELIKQKSIIDEKQKEIDHLERCIKAITSWYNF